MKVTTLYESTTKPACLWQHRKRDRRYGKGILLAWKLKGMVVQYEECSLGRKFHVHNTEQVSSLAKKIELIAQHAIKTFIRRG
jgi:hypothetical protein